MLDRLRYFISGSCNFGSWFYLGFERFGERVELENFVDVAAVRRRGDERRRRRNARSRCGGAVRFERRRRHFEVLHVERQSADDAHGNAARFKTAAVGAERS